MFNPRNIRYDSNGIPFFSPARLEEIATELLNKHCPHILRFPAPTPLLSILEELKKRTHLKVQMADLGEQDGHKVLGKVNFPTKTLFLDNSLTGDRAVTFQFTTAHEIGHWVLHRYNYRNWKLSIKGTEGLEDDAQSLSRLLHRSPKDWLEYQANTFAAALVMPRETFFTALINQQQTQGIRRYLGTVWLTDPRGQLDFVEIQSALADLFKVSLASIRVRLETLSLLRESNPPKKIRLDPSMDIDWSTFSKL